MEAYILRLAIQMIGRSCRLERIIGEDNYREIIESKEPFILGVWHNRIFYSTYFSYRFFARKGIPMGAIASQSGDGGLIAKVINMWGIPVARGSSSRGGREALQQLLRMVKKEKRSIATTPDGPRGPKYVFKNGIIVLAQATGAPIVPITFTAKSCLILNSWDNFIIPRPFSKITMSIGKKFYIPRGISEEQREKYRQEIEKEMIRVSDEVDRVYKK